jgi:RHS repeat-associated protein
LSSKTDELGHTTRYSYTDFNRLAMVMDAKGNITRYAYEPDGDLASITYADGSRESWTYNDAGHRLTWTNRRGQTIQYTPDEFGRVSVRHYPDGTEHSFVYDDLGRLTSYTDPLGTTTHEFYEDGRLKKITYPGGRWLSYTYDVAGRRTSMTDQLGHRSDYHYDARGRLESLTDESGVEIVRYAYDAVGRMERKTLGNGVYTTYAYDDAGHLLELANLKPGGSVLSLFAYTYDSRGRRDTMTTTYGAGDPRATLAGAWVYNYDDTGQLTGWTTPDGRRVDYTYDALGNRQKVRDNGGDTAYAVSKLNQYTTVGDTSYEYDADGNLIKKVAPEGTTTYDWSFENRLVSVSGPEEVWQNYYDATENRVRVHDNGSVIEYVNDPIGNGNVVGEYQEGSDNPLARYDHGKGLLSRRDSSGSLNYYGFDAIGSSSELVGHSGSIGNFYAVAPFGELIQKTEAVEQPFLFVGEQGVMAEGGQLSFMRARTYDLNAGRFTSPDPLGLASGDLNLYRHVGNNPVGRVDPSGFGETC